VQYEPEYARRLLAVQEASDLHWYPRAKRYDAGRVLEVSIRGVFPSVAGHARLELESAVGGGFAGQVYRAKLIELEPETARELGMQVGQSYAVKIMVPASGFRRAFRNVMYWLGYQARFSAQLLASAARAGALMQKLVRREAGARFGDERCVVDIYATFFDEGLGSYGEISEWVDGRNWQFEIDDEIQTRGKRKASEATMSREYLAKKEFMARLVDLFHDMGCGELARQYEWWSCKSQPNVLKRLDAGDDPAAGLTALDFRPGLALLWWLPMSPVDIRLAFKGLLRGDLVQFDRCDIMRLQAYCEARADRFKDMKAVLCELVDADREYRCSVPDVTHHHFRLLSDAALRGRIRSGCVEAWRNTGLVDEDHAGRLETSFPAFAWFWTAGLVPLLGRLCRRLWGNPAYRRHIGSLLGEFNYFGRALRASQARCLLDWYRGGAADAAGCDRYLRHPLMFACVRFSIGLLPPPKLRRFLTDRSFAWRATRDAVMFPVRFYRDAGFRVEWLTNEVEDGARRGMLTAAEREHILERIPDPFIQKYLKCVAVHFCTLPVTQIVSFMVAVYAYWKFGDTWQESLKWAAGIIVAFQFLPISPGSLVRGLYVAYLIVRERNIKNYWIAMLLSFWHYIGYLSFPIQMVGEFPGLARYMAGRWATKMVGIVPVFGEEGALFEHWAFDTFFNRPVSLKKRLRGAEHRG